MLGRKRLDLSAVRALTTDFPASARETVPGDTPAISASSTIVRTRLGVPG